ncbi:hypothetical protein LCGC14_0015170 [marine sediment metagenome]|uniref:Methyltransferase domain-containing protein n=1 Tax=marine sediment metagenome TaxID=412755 RepID=A0A0F9YFT8_9ZZZZ|nr:methyltransferase domain-containing protein [Phycisphaerae bacterium]HDZ43868.1 methyltransferase domain-containing protein [Phycisphaerae bacterium]
MSRFKSRHIFPQAILGPVAALYEKVAVPGLSAFHRQVAAAVAGELAGGRVLDVGTGPGRLLIEIARLGPDLELTGVDLSRRMLSIARSAIDRDAGDRAGDVRLVRGDVAALPFPDDAFDLVVSTLSLHHWRHRARGLQECLRVTAPGGQCWIYDLRTDVPAKRHAELVAASGLRRWALGWIFRFHGVKPSDVESQTVAQWLGAGAKVHTEQHEAYLKLHLRKPLPKRLHMDRADDASPVNYMVESA